MTDTTNHAVAKNGDLRNKKDPEERDRAKRRTFGVEQDDGVVVRGTVNPDIAHRIEEYFGHAIDGRVIMLRTRSTVSDRHSDKFELIEFAGPLDV